MMQRRPQLSVQLPTRLLITAGSMAAIAFAASCGEQQVTGPSMALPISASTVPVPTSSGCRSFQVTLGTGNTITVDSVALSWCGGFIKGTLRPEVSGTPTFDRTSGTVRIPIVLRNTDTVSLGALVRTVSVEDSVFIVSPTGLRNWGTGGPYVHFTNWDTASTRGGEWHYTPVRSGTVAPQYLPPKTLSQVKWVQMHVLSNVAKYQFMLWGTAPMVQNDTIHVHLDGGLTGHPSKDTIVPFGVAVPYAYTVRTGYSAPMLINNNASIPLSGNIITDSARVLTGWAPQTIVVTPDIQPLYNEIHGLLTASNPAVSFQTHITNSVALYKQVGETEFRRRMQLAETAAIDPIRDSAAIRRLETALNGNEFVILPRSGIGVSPLRRADAGVSASRVGVSANLVPGVSTDSAEPTAILYVNGIHTPDRVGRGTEAIITKLISEVNELSVNGRLSLSWVPNYTRNEAKPSTEAEIEADCAIYVAEWSPDTPRFNQGLWDCRKLLTNPQEWDLSEAIQQRILLSFTAAVPEADAIRLETKIMAHHASGEHVIVVAHSQGNMMAQTAINSLIASRQIDPTKDSACVGVMALAAPSSAHWPLDANHLKQVSVAGDFVASLSGWTATYTPLSRSADSAMAFTNPVVSPFQWFSAWMYWRIEILHDVNNSYLGQSITKTMIEADLDSLYRECTVGKVIALMPNEANFIPLGGYLPVTTQVNNRNGRQIFGRKLQWWSADSNIAKVDTNGSWFGVHPGTTKIVARSWQDTAATTVRASAHQTGLEGHWQGSYTKADGTFAYSTLDLGPGGTSGTLRYQWHSTSYNSVPVHGTATGDSLSATAVLTYTAIEDSAYVHFPCHNSPCITTLTVTAGAGDQWTGLSGHSQDDADMSVTRWSWTRVP